MFLPTFPRDLNVTIPTAPELGLFLDECIYSTYNEKWFGIHEEVSQEGYQEEIRIFKHEVVYEHIVGMENKEGQMALFLHSFYTFYFLILYHHQSNKSKVLKNVR